MSELNKTLTVRMYRGILGDFFLLRYNGGAEPRHLLIDCGVLQGTQGGAVRIKMTFNKKAEAVEFLISSAT